MKNIFDTLSFDCSKRTTLKYSTSFSLGILFLADCFRDPIYGIYGFVRLADEIVDSFHEYDKKCLLQKFKQDTWEAIDWGISLNPILNSFQKVVHDYGIEWELIDTFLKSMEMDLENFTYDHPRYQKYIFGSAEAVGLMCLRVFTQGDQAQYEQLRMPAMKLGAAFQKVNFLRDLREDYHLLGRTYFPGVSIEAFTPEEKGVIEKEIQLDFNEALKGIKQLPPGARKGVYLAYKYYQRLFNKIRELPSTELMSSRVRINNGHKMLIMLATLLRYQLKII